MVYDSNITIDTWKGQYKIDNTISESDRPGYFIKNIGYLSLWTYGDRHIAEYICHYNPITKTWIPCNNVQSIIHDIEQWILDQPPQLDQFQKAYEEDRVSVEHTFVEIENSKK